MKSMHHKKAQHHMKKACEHHEMAKKHMEKAEKHSDEKYDKELIKRTVKRSALK